MSIPELTPERIVPPVVLPEPGYSKRGPGPDRPPRPTFFLLASLFLVAHLVSFLFFFHHERSTLFLRVWFGFIIGIGVTGAGILNWIEARRQGNDVRFNIWGTFFGGIILADSVVETVMYFAGFSWDV